MTKPINEMQLGSDFCIHGVNRVCFRCEKCDEVTLGDDWKKMARSAPAPELSDEELPELTQPDHDFVQAVMDALPLVGNTEEEIAEMVRDYGAGRITDLTRPREVGDVVNPCAHRIGAPPAPDYEKMRKMVHGERRVECNDDEVCAYVREIAALKKRLEAAEAVCRWLTKRYNVCAMHIDVPALVEAWRKAGGK